MLVPRACSRALASLAVILLAGAARVEAGRWRGITPLHSTRADVERLLGPPSTDRGFIVFYRFGQERVSISYAEGPCGVARSGWNVPRDSVTHITVRPHRLSLSALRLDGGKFRERRNEHVRRVTHYVNEEEGVSYDVDTGDGGAVTAIDYFPAAADLHLRCPSPGQALKGTTKFDEYTDLTAEGERKRLDSFAEQLREHASATGYVVAYAGRRGRAGEAAARAARAKEYLVKVRGVEAGAVVAIDGGYREESTVELYLVPPGGAPPLPTPTVAPDEVKVIKVSGAKGNCRRAARPRADH